MTADFSSSRQWIPVALSRDIEPESAAPVIALGREFVLWRGKSGQLHAWEDRCPHRGMRLSFGFVRGERIACLYHGWRYDSDGGCDHIPAHPDLTPPKTICAAVFPCLEQDGLAWIWPDRESPPADAPPAFPEDAAPVRSIVIDAPSTVVIRELAGEKRSGARFYAVQPVDATRTALHVLTPNADAADLPARLNEAAGWCERLRRRLESSAHVAQTL